MATARIAGRSLDSSMTEPRDALPSRRCCTANLYSSLLEYKQRATGTVCGSSIQAIHT